MCILAGRVVAYTETEAERFRGRMPEIDVIVAPNALYPRSLIGSSRTLHEPTNIIFVGRLVQEKKPALLLEAFALAAADLPSDVRLVFVGSGPESTNLAARATSLGVADRVDFTGHLGGYDALRALYGNAIVAVSPGYVGLSLIQSLSFGVPMLIARDEPHSPEIEAAQADINSLFFRENDALDLGEGLRVVCRDRQLWLQRRNLISEDCAQRYCVELMANGLLQAFGV